MNYLIFIGIWLFCIIGYVMNIINVVHAVSEPITGLFVLECVGILAAPLGTILGWIMLF